MTRFGPQQDLFAPAPEPASPPDTDPLNELTALLCELRAAQHLPWRSATDAIPVELHALSLGRRAGPAGEALAAAILDETERLLAATD